MKCLDNSHNVFSKKKDGLLNVIFRKFYFQQKKKRILTNISKDKIIKA